MLKKTNGSLLPPRPPTDSHQGFCKFLQTTKEGSLQIVQLSFLPLSAAVLRIVLEWTSEVWLAGFLGQRCKRVAH